MTIPEAVNAETTSGRSSLLSTLGWLWKLLMVLLLGPLLLFPERFALPVVLVALALLLLPWAVYVIQQRRLLPPSPVNFLLLLLLLIFLPLSLWVTPLFWQASWPKATSLLWSAALFFAVVAAVPPDLSPAARYGRLRIMVFIYLAAGLAMTAVGLLGIPRVAGFLPGSLQENLLALVPGARINPNEVGGIITLYLPLLVALWAGAWADPQRRSWWRFLLFGLLILFAGAVLLLTASFGALTGVLAGTVLILLAMNRRARWLLLPLGILTLLGLLAVRLSPFYDRLAVAVNTRWTDSILIRLGIWQQAEHAVQDFPLLGTGLGAFRYIAPVLYPLGQLENDVFHAHNLFWQAALDFGWLGGLLFALIWLLVFIYLLRALRQLSSDSSAAPLRSIALGLLGGLVAHALYSLFDALAPGARPGFMLWFLFGLSIAVGAGLVPERPSARRWRFAFQAAFSAVILILFAVLFWRFWPAQQASSVAARALLGRPDLIQPAAALAARSAGQSCRLDWHLGRLAHEANDPQTRDEAWQQLLGCSSRYTAMMQQAAPDARDLAETAVARQPADPAGYFWRAAQESASDPTAAITYLEQGLALAPADGLKWRELGDLRQAAGDQLGAVRAYNQACFYVDRGKNGCMRAANLYIAAGSYELAAERYRSALEQLPGYRPARRGLADALLAQGLDDEALPHLTILAGQGDTQAQQQLQGLMGDDTP